MTKVGVTLNSTRLTAVALCSPRSRHPWLRSAVQSLLGIMSAASARIARRTACHDVGRFAASLKFAVAQRGELFEELLFLIRKILRELADQTNVLVAAAGAFDMRKAAAGQAEQAIVLRSGRDFHRALSAQRWDVDFAT